MTLGEFNSIWRQGTLSIDATWPKIGYVGEGQADGPYPGMYEHWASLHTYERSGLAAKLYQTDFELENTP